MKSQNLNNNVCNPLPKSNEINKFPRVEKNSRIVFGNRKIRIPWYLFVYNSKQLQEQVINALKFYVDDRFATAIFVREWFFKIDKRSVWKLVNTLFLVQFYFTRKYKIKINWLRIVFVDSFKTDLKMWNSTLKYCYLLNKISCLFSKKHDWTNVLKSYWELFQKKKGLI